MTPIDERLKEHAAARVDWARRELAEALAAERAIVGEQPEQPDDAIAVLKELVACHFSVLEHSDPEEEARRSHARMGAAWERALKVLRLHKNAQKLG